MSTDTTNTTTDDWAAPVQQQMDESFDEMAGLDLDAEGLEPDAMGGGDFIDREGKYHLEISDAPFKSAAESFRKTNPEFQVRCVVLQSVQGQSPAGSVLFHHVEIPVAADHDKLVGKSQTPLFGIKLAALCNFAIACGVLEKRDGKVYDPETKSSKLNTKTLGDRLKGKQFIGKVVSRLWWDDKDETVEKIDSKTGKQGISYELDRYHPATAVDDPANYGVPMDMAALAAIGKKRATAPENGNAPAGNGNGNGKAKAAPASSHVQQSQQPQQQSQQPVAAAQSDELDI